MNFPALLLKTKIMCTKMTHEEIVSPYSFVHLYTSSFCSPPVKQTAEDYFHEKIKVKKKKVEAGI